MDNKEVDFLNAIYKLLEDECVFSNTEDKPVVVFENPEDLMEKIDFKLMKPVEKLDELIDLCKGIIKYSVKTRHPFFCNQLYGGADLFGLGASWISEALNTNQHTFEVAPAFTLCESALLNHVMKLFGYTDGDGIFAPGGSISNMYGLVLARYKRYPNVKTAGMQNLPQIVCFTSDQAHYSIAKGMHWLGMGIDNLIKVPTDHNGRMIPAALEAAIIEQANRGRVPLFVNATVGTTVLGAIDPLQEIASICKRYGTWMHVDACYGGALALCDKQRYKLNGIERSDSIAWNPHKMLGAPLQCSVIITKHKNLLLQCNSASACYLFQQDKHYDVSYDTGDKSIQCGRKVDAFKLWVMWKARGDMGLGNAVDKALECVSYVLNKISQTPGYRLVLREIDYACVCFWYIPKKMRQQEETDAWRETLNQVAPKIKEKMVKEGTLMIGYTPAKGFGNFFRLVVNCFPEPTTANMDYIVEKIQEYGETIEI